MPAKDYAAQLSSGAKHAVDRRDHRAARGCVATLCAALLTLLIGAAAAYAACKLKFRSGFVLALLSALLLTVTNCLVLWWPTTLVTLINIVANVIVLPSVVSIFRDLGHTWSDMNQKCGEGQLHLSWGSDIECSRARSLVPLSLILFVLLFCSLVAMVCGVICACYIREREGLAAPSRMPNALKRHKHNEHPAQATAEPDPNDSVEVPVSRGRGHRAEDAAAAKAASNSKDLRHAASGKQLLSERRQSSFCATSAPDTSSPASQEFKRQFRHAAPSIIYED